MAYEKKTATGTKTPEKKTTTAAPAAKNVDEINELKTLVSNLQQQNEMLMKLLMSGQKDSQPVATPTSLEKEIKIVHLVERAPNLTTHIGLSNLSIDFHNFGETRTIDLRQAEELAGAHRRLFEKGIIAFGAGSEEIANRFGLKSVSDYSYVNKEFLRKLGGLKLIELENLWSVLADGHKEFVIEYFKRKILEGDPAFKDVHKVELLNRLSDGAMSGTTLDLKREAEESAKK